VEAIGWVRVERLRPRVAFVALKSVARVVSVFARVSRVRPPLSARDPFTRAS
jgi:hypothetical protein